MRRLNKVKIEWSLDFAYAIGLLTTDGNLSSDGRHLNMTSKDKDLIITFKKCLNLQNKIGKKSRGGSKVKKYFQLQFGDKNFYNFLLNLGLTPAKSKTIKSLNIPDTYFADFLRGCIDGDGTIGAFRHPESKHLQLRTRLYSSSPEFLDWIKQKINDLFKIKTGHIQKNGSSVYALVYSKRDSFDLLKCLYYNGVKSYLKRKYLIAKKFM